MPSRLLPGLEMTDFLVRAGYSVLPYLLCLLCLCFTIRTLVSVLAQLQLFSVI